MNFGSGAAMNQSVKSNRTLQKRLRNPLKDRYKAKVLKHKNPATNINIRELSGGEIERAKMRIQEDSRKQKIQQLKIGLVTLAILVAIYWYGDWSIDWSNWMAY
ncbi:MAG: hypothetical protein Sapg2KO_29620 [Saprospiraceae bacterium]